MASGKEKDGLIAEMRKTIAENEGGHLRVPKREEVAAQSSTRTKGRVTSPMLCSSIDSID